MSFAFFFLAKELSAPAKRIKGQKTRRNSQSADTSITSDEEDFIGHFGETSTTNDCGESSKTFSGFLFGTIYLSVIYDSKYIQFNAYCFSVISTNVFRC